MPCEHDWEEIWDDEVGQRCCICMICDEERIFQYDVEKCNLENRISHLEAQLQDCADVLNVFAQFAKIKAHQHEYVTICVNIDTVQECKRLLGGAFRDLSLGEDIPV